MYNNYYNQEKQTVLNRLLGAWQAVPEPLKATTVILGFLGCLTVGKRFIKRLKKNKESSNRSEPSIEPLETVSEQFESTVKEPLDNDIDDISDEEIERELTRRVMSTLGKRSGESRRRKRDRH